MGWLDALLGRSKPVAPDLDALFALPSAAIGLEAAAGLWPTGSGSVCVKPVEGADFSRTHDDVNALLKLDAETAVEDVRDSFGYLWTSCSTTPERLADLVTALHGANSTYEAAGYGSGLLCSVVGFEGEVNGTHRRVGLVYLYKRGAFYPFAPTGGQTRDTAFELQLRGALGDDLRVEQDIARWFPVWGAPGLG